MQEQEEKPFDVNNYLERIGGLPENISSGILFLPHYQWQNDQKIAFMSETYNLAKWARSNSTVEINILQSNHPVADLHSYDFWFPLAFLASDVAFPVYLNLLSNYVYDRIRGALKSDKCEVHIEVIKNENQEIKRISYHGDIDGLKALIKKIDIN